MTLRLSSRGRMIRASLVPLFLSTLVIGCGPSDVGTIKAGTKEEEAKNMFPTVAGKKVPKAVLPGGPVAKAPGK
jgi:hypothetical protein